VLRERIAGISVAVAAPLGQSVHRQDLLALLRWTLPALRDAVDVPPERLLIVSAGDPMWRGGLSAPRSAFLHAARPLISDDGTSPLLHEVVHVSLGIWPGEGGDWIVEGMAEFYSMQLLMRSHTTSHRRFDKSLAKLAARGSGVASLETGHAHGALVAHAVTVLWDLDREIRGASGDTRSLDDLLRELARRRGAVTTKLLRETAEQVAGRDLAGFFARHGLASPAARGGAAGAPEKAKEVR
jgi:hypothetical protein